MHPRVTAILVARNGGARLARTLEALAAQTHRPDVTITVDVSSSDETEAQISAFGPTHQLTVREGTSFGDAIAHATQFLSPEGAESEWLWLLGHDNAPATDALEMLLASVEVAPSVAVAGPKLMSADDPDWLADFGQTLTRFGATVHLVSGELDQAQHDTQDDVLGVAAAGMLVRRSLWERLAGFDPGLPSIDAALDFSVRARLAGHRVTLVPGAKVSSAGGPEEFARQTSPARTFRIARAAQLHRRLVYSPAWAVFLHWLSLVPLALARSIGDLIAKRPGAIRGELAAAFAAAFTGGVGSARRQLRRNRPAGWGAIAPLRMPTSEVRERRAQAREAELAELDAIPGTTTLAPPRAGFVAHAGLWVVVVAGVVGLLAFGGLLAGTALSGGGLVPLSHTVAELWSNIGIGWRAVGTGAFGAADPFALVLALLGSVTFWNPSTAIVVLYVLALPLSALAAWCTARRITRNLWLPTLTAILWALAPPLLSALSEGRLGAVIAHLILPWLFLAALGAARSWASGGAAALLLAALAASAPSLVPALAVLFVLLLATHPARVHRIIGIPVPTLVLFAPLAVQQFLAGHPFAIFADPGVPVASPAASGWQLALADGQGDLHGWAAAIAGLPVPGISAPILVAILFAPLAILAMLALFLPGSRRAVPSIFIALLGFATAVLAQNVVVGHIGTHAVSVGPGPGLSLQWLGLIAAALCTLEVLGRVATPLSVLASLTTLALAIPLLGAVLIGTAHVHPSGGRIMPALVTAEARSTPGVRTLVITPYGDSEVSVGLERDGGATLDDQATIVSTKTVPDALDLRLATLAGNLAARSGFDFAEEFRSIGVSFVLVPGADKGGEVSRATVEALDGNETLNPVGSTANGRLWRYEGVVDQLPAHPGNTDTTVGRWYLLALGVVFGVTLLLAVPIGGRGRRQRRPSSDEPANTFDEEEHD